MRAADRFQAIKAAAAARPHGTRARYVGARCRCLLCRAANSRYQSERDRAKREMGDRRDLVAANGARQHILALGRRGIGYKSVADAASVSRTITGLIKSGARRRIRRDTAARILAVTTEAIAGGALVPAAGTWRRLDELISRGYSKAQLARWMGYRSPSIQIKRSGKITAATEARVRKLYDAVNAGRLRRA